MKRRHYASDQRQVRRQKKEVVVIHSSMTQVPRTGNTLRTTEVYTGIKQTRPGGENTRHTLRGQKQKYSGGG